MITARYYIEFDSADVDMCSRIEISKTEFNRQLSFLTKKIEETKDCENFLETHIPIVTQSNEATTTYYTFNCGSASTYLTKIECKEGYQFKRKNSRR